MGSAALGEVEDPKVEDPTAEGAAEEPGVYHAVMVMVAVTTAQAEPAGSKPEPEPGPVDTGATGPLELGLEPAPGAL